MFRVCWVGVKIPQRIGPIFGGVGKYCAAAVAADGNVYCSSVRFPFGHNHSIKYSGFAVAVHQLRELGFLRSSF